MARTYWKKNKFIDLHISPVLVQYVLLHCIHEKSCYYMHDTCSLNALIESNWMIRGKYLPPTLTYPMHVKITYLHIQNVNLFCWHEF